MSLPDDDPVLQERVAQLESIAARRNELLRQLFHLIRSKHLQSTLYPAHDDDPDLHTFLRKHDLAQNPDSASIQNLDESALFSPTIPLNPPSALALTSVLDAPGESLDVEMDEATSDLKEPLSTADDSASSHSPPGAIALLPEEPYSSSSLSSNTKEPQSSTSNLIQESTNSNDVSMEARQLPVADMQGGDEEENLDLACSTTNGDQPLPPTSVSPAQLQLTPEPTTVAEHDDLQTQNETSPRHLTPPPSSTEQSAGGSRTSPGVQVDGPAIVPFTPSSPKPKLFSSFETPAPVHYKRQLLIPIPTNHLPSIEQFQFGLPAVQEPPKLSTSPVLHHHQFDRNYSLPPLKSLPPEFNRKTKHIKLQRKREKEREKDRKKDGGKDDWVPMGLNKWSATINANPVWRKVSRASKCLTTREWAVAMDELRLVRTLDRVESLKDAGRWSFRQPKKQRGVGGLAKTHWDYLMDEMKWMRADFREERKWKLALAYNLSTAVLEWHALKSWEERAAHGICVKWKSTFNRVEQDQGADDCSAESMDVDQPEGVEHNEDRAQSSLLGIDYGSDEGDEDDKQSVVDALEPSAIIEDALNASETQNANDTFQPKKEDIDDAAALHVVSTQLPVAVDEGQIHTAVEGPLVKHGALKSASNDPLLVSKSTSQSLNGDLESPAAPPKSSRIDMFSPLRQSIAYSDTEQLFLDTDDLCKRTEYLSLAPGVSTPDLSELFPDLPLFSLLDTPAAPIETKKKTGKRDDKDDPNKRVEEATYTKLYPTGRFMFSKPTLLGSLQPSKRWVDGKWLQVDENPVSSEPENVTKIPEDSQNELFDNRITTSTQGAVLSMQSLHMHATMHATFIKDKDSKKKGSELIWSEQDDMLLKTLLDKYFGNWTLISECFNDARKSTATDRRTWRDCVDRWREKWAPDVRQRAIEPVPSSAQDDNITSSGPSSMTTRGVKRLASASISASNTNGGLSSTEPKKRRRHILLQEAIRKAAKKKADHAQKTAAAQRKTTVVHETHNQYSKLPKLNAAELSRMKTEKDSADQREVLVARRRQEELNRQMQAQRMGHAVQPAPLVTQPPSQPLQGQIQAQGQAQTQAQPQPQSQPQPQVQVQVQPVAQQVLSQPPPSQVGTQTNGSPAQRPSGVAMAVPPNRNQVNISRMSTPASGPRISQQQIMQMQAQAQVRAAAVAGVQVQVQAAGHGVGQGQLGAGSVNGLAGGSHSSPPRSGAQGNIVNSPRPGLEQLQVQNSTAVTANGVGRPVSNVGSPYYLNMFTPEQVQNALRFQMQQQQQQMLQQQQQQGSNSNMNP